MTMAETRQAVAAEIRKAWGWLLAWGLVLVLAGIVGLGYQFMVSVVTTIFVGGLMVAYGVMEVVQSFRHRRWSGFLLFFLGGILSIVAGALVWSRPVAAMEVLTLLAAAWFLVLGSFRIVVSVSSRHPGWGWGLFNGAISMLLGVLVWSGWPMTGLWVIGMFVCVDMVLAGWNYVMLALAVRQGAAAVAGGH